MSTPLVTPNLLAQMRMAQAPMPALPAAPVMPSMPQLPAVAAPLVSKVPTQIERDQSKLDYYKDSGSGVDQIENPLLRGIARAGDIAASVFAPGIARSIPGTSLHHQFLVKQQEGNLANDQATQKAADEDAQSKANTDYIEQKPEIAKAQTEQKMAVARVHADQAAAKAGQMPVDNPDGSVSYVDDPTSAAYQSRKIHDDVQTAQQQLTEANEEVRRASLDPNSPAYQLAVSKANTAKINAGAAVQRAQAYYGNYLQHAYNKGLGGDTLPGAPQIEDNTGNVSTVGSTNASQAVKAQANAAQFGDVHGALDNLEQKARALVQSGGKLNSPGVVYALQHLGTGTPSQIIESINKANLSPQERDYVISNLAAHENVQALRKSAGGTATDTSVAKLDALLPNGATPDLDYLLNQTGQIRQTAERLGRGVTVVKGGLGVPGGNANNGGSGVKKYNPSTGRLE